jgi:hypothetical protein
VRFAARCAERDTTDGAILSAQRAVGFGPLDAVLIGEALRTNASCTHLDLSGNAIGGRQEEFGLKALVEPLLRVSRGRQGGVLFPKLFPKTVGSRAQAATAAALDNPQADPSSRSGAAAAPTITAAASVTASITAAAADAADAASSPSAAALSAGEHALTAAAALAANQRVLFAAAKLAARAAAVMQASGLVLH